MHSQFTYNSTLFSSQNKFKNTPVFNSSSSGKEKDSETGYYYFGARYYNPDLSLWLSVDPMSDKYPSLSPYNYCAWNPMKLIDPKGKEIDISALYEKNRDGSYKYKNLIKAFEFFANTKWGRKELAKYAKAGQVIAGQKFTENGEFHDKNIDISFGGKVSQPHYSGDTGRELKDGRLKISINISNVSDIGSVLETFCHETFIHAYQTSKDFIDDGDFNNQSSMSTGMRMWKASRAMQEHGEDARVNKRMMNETVPILRQYYNSTKSPRTDSQIIKLINSGMGMYNHLRQ